MENKSPLTPTSPTTASDHSPSVLQRLRAAFAHLPDSRQRGKVLHRLDEVLLCAFCSILCNGESYTDMEDFAEAQLPWLRGFLTLEHGAPSHDVFRNVFMMLQPQSVLDIFTRWCGSLAGLQVAIDGKTLRGALLCETLELSHGRCEKREYQMLGQLDWFAKSWKWAGLQAVGRVRREIQRGRDGGPQIEVHYFLCSFKDDIKRFAALVRGHWSVENRCHWVLDVTFGEDHCQVRDRTAAHNFSLMRELALKVLRDHPVKLSLRRKRRRAALDPDFRLQILANLHA
jgi:predicted transposase YbfD/YdcC